jgi:uncharacterized protein YuzE
MTETYLEESDTLVIELNSNAPYQRIRPAKGLTVILDEGGNVCAFELDNASGILGDMEYLMVQEVDAIESPLTADDYSAVII